MKFAKVLLLTSIAFFSTSCIFRRNTSVSSSNISSIISQPSSSSESKTESSSSQKSSSSSSSSESSKSLSASSSSSTSSGPTKVTVPAHTLEDSDPPIDVDSMGDVITEDTWNSFRYGDASKYLGNYNYTYRAYSGGVETIEAFTKDGYFTRTNYGKLYYERKSGSTFYQYISTNSGYLRDETTLDIENKYTSRIISELYVHMFDFSDYEYDEYDGSYTYRTTAFGSTLKFQNGYLTFLYYAIGYSFFEIKLSFETTIDIPESYYFIE